MLKKRAFLFDLDGTLLDTAPDLLFALNQLRHEQGLSKLSLPEVRGMISLGSKEMIKYALNLDESHATFAATRKQFLDTYATHLSDSTVPFPNINDVLNHLEKNNIPWGIVTNKLTRHAMHLLKVLGLADRARCIICGDTLTTYKPDPEPLLHASNLMQQNPKHCVYIGDSVTDVKASKAAGMKSIVALYGYIHAQEDPYAWLADGYIHHPLEILKWV